MYKALKRATNTEKAVLRYRTALEKLFPLLPNIGLVADSCLTAVADDWRFHQRAVLEQLFLLVLVVGEVGKRRITLAFLVEQVVQSTDSLQHAVQFTLGHALLRKVDHLEFNAAFFELALRLFGVKTLIFSENLYIHAVISFALLFAL